jgi:hypothetical protein
LESSIKLDLKKTTLEAVYCAHLDQDGHIWRAFVNTVMDLVVP